MSFAGPYPYGTPGGYEQDTPQYQGDPNALAVVTADGHGFTAFLTLNGALTTRNPASLSEIIRTETSGGIVALAITVQENGANVDINVSVLDAEAGIRAYAISPGVIGLEIPANGIAIAMIPDGIITNAKLVNATVTAAKIAAAANILGSQLSAAAGIVGTQLANGTINTAQIAGGAVTEAQLSGSSAPRFSANAARDGATAVNVTSLTGAVILSDTIVLPNDGLRWYFRIDVGAALNAPSGQFIRIAGAVRDGATDLLLTSYVGTGTVAGERWAGIGQISSVISTGQTLTFELRAKVTGGTGTVNQAMLVGDSTVRAFKGT